MIIEIPYTGELAEAHIVEDDPTAPLTVTFGRTRPACYQLVSCPGSSLAESTDLVQDDIGSRGPGEWDAVVIVVFEILLDGSFEGGHALERAAANPSRGDRREEAFYLIQPTRARRSEMQVVARMPHEPADDLRRFVRPVVVHNDVHVAVGRQLGIDAREKF